MKKEIEILDRCGLNLLQDNRVNDVMSNMTRELATQINKKREEIIVNRLKELKIDIDIEKEQERRFKRLMLERNGNNETIYFDDGTQEGKRIVTFTPKYMPITQTLDKTEISVEYSYY